MAAAAGRAGYEAACTLPARIHPARPLEWPRVGVYHDDSDRRYRLKVSRAVRAVRSSRAWDALERRAGADALSTAGAATGVLAPMRTRTMFERPAPFT